MWSLFHDCILFMIILFVQFFSHWRVSFLQVISFLFKAFLSFLVTEVICWCLSGGLGWGSLSCPLTVSYVTYWQSLLSSVPWVCPLSCGDKVLIGPCWTGRPGGLQSVNPVDSELNSTFIIVPLGHGTPQSKIPYSALSGDGTAHHMPGQGVKLAVLLLFGQIWVKLLSYLPCYPMSSCTWHDHSRPFQGITGPFPLLASHSLNSALLFSSSSSILFPISLPPMSVS